MVLLFQIYQQLQSGRYIVKKSRRVIYCYLQISGGKKARGASFEKAFWGKTLAFLNQNWNQLGVTPSFVTGSRAPKELRADGNSG